jgi:hypothetical protein
LSIVFIQDDKKSTSSDYFKSALQAVLLSCYLSSPLRERLTESGEILKPVVASIPCPFHVSEGRRKTNEMISVIGKSEVRKKNSSSATPVLSGATAK